MNQHRYPPVSDSWFELYKMPHTKGFPREQDLGSISSVLTEKKRETLFTWDICLASRFRDSNHQPSQRTCIMALSFCCVGSLRAVHTGINGHIEKHPWTGIHRYHAINRVNSSIHLTPFTPSTLNLQYWTSHSNGSLRGVSTKSRT